MHSSSSSDIFVAVLQHYGIFQPENQYKIVCPFHGDVNPSLQINIPQAYYYCYGCGRTGSSIELIQEFEPNLTKLQAQKKLMSIGKGRGGYRGVGKGIYSTVTAVTEVDYLQQLRNARDYYYNLPKTNWYKTDEEVAEIKHYLKNRGIKNSSLVFTEAKFTFNPYYPVVFPLLENGVFRGYVMRTNRTDVEDRRKYMYNPGFRRKLCLAGTYKRKEPILLVEGFLDYLAAKQLGIKNVAPILGWKISREQMAKLQKKGITKIYCGLDNDSSGRKGYKYLKRQKEFQIIRICFPKNVKDFGDLLKNPTAAEHVLRQLREIL